VVPPPPAGSEVVAWSIGGLPVLSRVASGTLIGGFLPVVAATIGASVLMWAVSLATTPPSAETRRRYFPA
jgi:hypothetical protein